MTSPTRSAENYLARFSACRHDAYRNCRNGWSSSTVTVQVGDDVVALEFGQVYGTNSIRGQCIKNCTSIHKVDDALEVAILGNNVQRGPRFRRLIWVSPTIE